MNRKAIIFGVKGLSLTRSERHILRKNTPWGIILFSRNINSFLQLQALINDIKKITRDKKFPILIDQEGGRVSRFNKIIDLSKFSQKFFAELYSKDRKAFYFFIKTYIDNTCSLMKKIGININTSPVLDVFRKKSNKIIGDRSFSSDPIIISEIGKIYVKLHHNNKIGTVIKHIPGHGLATKDSHIDLPVINEKNKILFNKDFKVFKNSNSHFAMTAHVIYKNLDKFNTATHSKIIINKIIRKYIGFKGILISDDISMKALKYDLKKNAKMALDAGCNLILHCNGNIKEMNELVKVVPKIDNFIKKKTSHFYNFLG